MRFYKQKNKSESFERIYCRGHAITILQDEEQLRLANSMVKPAFCTDCSKIEEDSAYQAFKQDMTEFSRFYCGCKGWE